MYRSRLSSTTNNEDSKMTHGRITTSTSSSQQKKKSVTSSGYGVVTPTNRVNKEKDNATSLAAQQQPSSSSTGNVKSSRPSLGGNTATGVVSKTNVANPINSNNNGQSSSTSTPTNRSSMKKQTSLTTPQTSSSTTAVSSRGAAGKPLRSSSVNDTSSGGNRMIYSLISPLSTTGGGSGGRVKSSRFSPRASLDPVNLLSEQDRELSSESKDSASLFPSPVQSASEDFLPSSEIIPNRTSPITVNPNRYSNSHEETPILTVAALKEKRMLEGLEPLGEEDFMVAPSYSTDADGTSAASSSGSVSTPSANRSANAAIRKSLTRSTTASGSSTAKSPRSAPPKTITSAVKTPAPVQKSSGAKTTPASSIRIPGSTPSSTSSITRRSSLPDTTKIPQSILPGKTSSLTPSLSLSKAAKPTSTIPSSSSGGPSKTKPFVSSLVTDRYSTTAVHRASPPRNFVNEPIILRSSMRSSTPKHDDNNLSHDAAINLVGIVSPTKIEDSSDNPQLTIEEPKVALHTPVMDNAAPHESFLSEVVAPKPTEKVNPILAVPVVTVEEQKNRTPRASPIQSHQSPAGESMAESTPKVVSIPEITTTPLATPKVCTQQSLSQPESTPSPSINSVSGTSGSVNKPSLRRNSYISTPPNLLQTSTPRELALIRNNRISSKIVDLSKQIVKSQQQKEEELYAFKAQQLQQQLEQLQQLSSPSSSVTSPIKLNMNQHFAQDSPAATAKLMSPMNEARNEKISTNSHERVDQLTENSRQQQPGEQQQVRSFLQRNKFIEDDRNNGKRNSFHSAQSVSTPPVPSSRWSKLAPSTSSPLPLATRSSSPTSSMSMSFDDSSNNDVPSSPAREKPFDRFPSSLAMANRPSLLSSSTEEAEENLLLDQMPPARLSSPFDSPRASISSTSSSGSTLPRVPSFTLQQPQSLLIAGARIASPFIKRVGSTESNNFLGNHVTNMAVSVGARHMSPLRQPSPSIQSRQIQQQQLNQRLSNSSISSVGSGADSPALAKSLLLRPSARSTPSPSMREHEVAKAQQQQPQQDQKSIADEANSTNTLIDNQGFLADDGSVISSIGSISTHPGNQSIYSAREPLKGPTSNRFPGSVNNHVAHDSPSVMSGKTTDSTTSDEQLFSVVQPLSFQKHHLLKPVVGNNEVLPVMQDSDLYSLSMSEADLNSVASPNSRQSSVLFDTMNKSTTSTNSSLNQRNLGNRQMMHVSTGGVSNPMKKQISIDELSKMTDDFNEDISLSYGLGGSCGGQYSSLVEDCSIGIAERPTSIGNANNANHTSGTNPANILLTERSTPQHSHPALGVSQKSPLMVNDYFHPILDDHRGPITQPVDISDAFVKDIENDVLSESGSKSIASRNSPKEANSKSVSSSPGRSGAQTQKPSQVGLTTSISTNQVPEASHSVPKHSKNMNTSVTSSLRNVKLADASMTDVVTPLSPLINKPSSQLATLATATTASTNSTIPSDYNRLMLKKQRDAQRKQMFEQERAKHQNVKVIYRRFKAIGHQWENAQTEISSTDDGVCLVIILPYLFQLDVKLVPATMLAKSLFSLKKFRMNLFAMNCITDVSSVLDTSTSGFSHHRPDSYGSGGSGEHHQHHRKHSEGSGKNKRKKSSNHHKKSLDNHMTYEYTLDNTPQDSADAAALYLENEKGITKNNGSFHGSNRNSSKKNENRDSNSFGRSSSSHGAPKQQRPGSNNYRRPGDDVSTLTNSVGGMGNGNGSSHGGGDLESDYLTSGNSDDEDNDDSDIVKYETIKVEIHANRHIFSKEKRITDENTEFVGEYKLEGWNASLNHRHVTHRYDKETGMLMIFIDRIRFRELDLSHYVKNQQPQQQIQKSSNVSNSPMRNNVRNDGVGTVFGSGVGNSGIVSAPTTTTPLTSLPTNPPVTPMDDDNASMLRNITKRGRYHFPGEVHLGGATEQDGRLAAPPGTTMKHLSNNRTVSSSGSQVGGLLGAVPIVYVGNGGSNFQGNHYITDNESVTSNSQMKSMGGNNTVTSFGSRGERSFPRGLADERSRNSGGFSVPSGKFNTDQDRIGSPFQSVKKHRRGGGGDSNTVRSNGSTRSMNSGASQSVNSGHSSPSTSPVNASNHPFIGSKTYEV